MSFYLLSKRNRIKRLNDLTFTKSAEVLFATLNISIKEAVGLGLTITGSKGNVKKSDVEALIAKIEKNKKEE